MTLDNNRSFRPIGIAVLTVSDTRTAADDTSGDLLAERVEAAGHTLAARGIVLDDIVLIQTRLQEWIIRTDVLAIILTGGTGLTGRDVTPEAVRPLLDKEIDGFQTVMHMVSYGKIGTSTLQSRTLAGISGETYIFCLPGSPGACADAWDNILQPQLDNRHRPCNFIGIADRLGESRTAPARSPVTHDTESISATRPDQH